MHYFYLADTEQHAINAWNSSQFDLCDIVLGLTDNSIIIGAKLYALFCRKEILDLMHIYICDFKKIKEDLGIVGEYVERRGNCFADNFNPKRNTIFLALSPEQMQYLAKIVYKNIFEDLNDILINFKQS